MVLNLGCYLFKYMYVRSVSLCTHLHHYVPLGDKNRNDPPNSISKFVQVCASIPCKRYFFVFHTQNKTKHTMKEYPFETFCSQDFFCQNCKVVWNVRRSHNIQKQYDPLQIEGHLLTTSQE